MVTDIRYINETDIRYINLYNSDGLGASSIKSTNELSASVLVPMVEDVAVTKESVPTDLVDTWMVLVPTGKLTASPRPASRSVRIASTWSSVSANTRAVFRSICSSAPKVVQGFDLV